MRGAQRVTGQVAAATVLRPPGRYHDGPVHIRVEKARAGAWCPPSADYKIELNDWRCTWDPTYDYVEVENTHNAFIYVREMISKGLPTTTLAVVRLAHLRRPTS
ncbi:MAG: hypothetical protein ACRDRH_05550 [Pseudonocardia sp.]